MIVVGNIFDKSDAIVRKIESGYLLNYEEEGNRFKIVPSESDKENFKKIILGIDGLTDSKLKETFDFFTDKKRFSIQTLYDSLKQQAIGQSIQGHAPQLP